MDAEHSLNMSRATITMATNPDHNPASLNTERGSNRTLRPNTSRTKLTPPMVARMWGVKCQKVLTWIRSGELRAINVASRREGRPRYLIDIQDLALFERSREVCPKPVVQHIRKSQRPTNIMEYF